MEAIRMFSQCEGIVRNKDLANKPFRPPQRLMLLKSRPR